MLPRKWKERAIQDTKLIDASPNTADTTDTPAETGIARTLDRQALLTLLLIFSCFTLASSGFLAWLYHLMLLAEPDSVEALTTGGGYLCQGAGLLVAAVILRTRPQFMNRVALVAAIIVHFGCTLLATTSATLTGTIAFGYVMSVLCGFISSFYLAMLARCVHERRRGTVFGVGYACSTIVTWLLSMAPPLFPETTGILNELVWCAAFSVMAVFVCIFALGAKGAPFPEGKAVGAHVTRALVILACITVVLMSMVKGIGGGFPSSDIGATVNLEASRLLYAVGLVIAGLVIDLNRKYGAVLCLAALFVPFALLALSGEPVPSVVLWAVDYLFFGFFSVFRVVLFADLAADEKQLHLSGFGLMFGRLGDALGTFACLALGGRTVILVVVAAALFVATVFALFRLAQQLFMTPPEPEQDENRRFDEFANRHNLSRRECDMLRLVLDKRTNPEIAEALVLSENTVKFHMRNLLKKTGCKNRAELFEKYGGKTEG